MSMLIWRMLPGRTYSFLFDRIIGNFCSEVFIVYIQNYKEIGCTMNTRPTAALKLRRDIKGIDRKVPVLNGRKSRYIYLDNAASTPPLQTVLNQIDEYWN